jgi:hypothetical protein
VATDWSGLAIAWAVLPGLTNLKRMSASGEMDRVIRVWWMAIRPSVGRAPRIAACQCVGMVILRAADGEMWQPRDVSKAGALGQWPGARGLRRSSFSSRSWCTVPSLSLHEYAEISVMWVRW